MAGGHEVQKMVCFYEWGVELHQMAVMALQVFCFVTSTRFAEVAVPILFVGFAAATGEHAEEAVPGRGADQGFDLGGQVVVQPFGEGRVVFVRVEQVPGAGRQAVVPVDPADLRRAGQGSVQQTVDGIQK